MSAASERWELTNLLMGHPAIPRGPGVAGSVCPTCPREINGECNSLDHAEHQAEVLIAAGFTRQSRAEIQAGGDDLDLLANDAAMNGGE